VLICHKPENQNATKIVNVNAVQAHLDHGDMLGSCICPPDQSRPGLDIEASQPVTLQLEVKGYPNPSNSAFQVTVTGADENEVIQLRITDIQGRLVELRSNLRSGQTLTIGGAYRAGTYIAEISTVSGKKTLKLVKL
jgi:hypothetical protein